MISDETKLFECPVCGFRVGSEESVCPRCGNHFTRTTRFECPFCGGLVDQGAEAFPACHVNYSEFRAKTESKGRDDTIDLLLTEIIRMEAAEVRSEARKFSCPICAWLMDGTESTCPKCGKSFIEDLTFQCPVCGSLVHPDAERCPECGSLFEEGVSVHEEAADKLDEIVDVTGAGVAPAATDEEGREQEEMPAKARESSEETASPLEGIARATGQALGSIFGAGRQGPQPEPTPKPEETAPEALPDQEPSTAMDALERLEAVLPAPEQITEEPAPARETLEAKPEAAAPKKPKQRKLKAKPQGAKPKHA